MKSLLLGQNSNKPTISYGSYFILILPSIKNLLFRPFKLRNPKGGFISKRHPYYAGGDWGNREERISDLVHRMI